MADHSTSYETETTATFNEHNNDAPPTRWTRKREIKVVEELGQDIGPTRIPFDGEVAQESKEPLEMVHMGEVWQLRPPSAVAQEPVKSNLDLEAQGIIEAPR